MCTAKWTRQGAPMRCGQCMECRLAYSREWAIRMTHEKTMHDASCFLTLTFDDEHLPAHGQLLKRPLVLFFKRLRKRLGKFRYVACGEYGDLRLRPHYHVALFGLDFSADRVQWGEGIKGHPLYISHLLSELWGLGAMQQQTIGELSFESCAYIGRYLTKAQKGPGAVHRELFRDPDTGEITYANPPFLVCSKGRVKGHGIGAGWFHDHFMSDVFPHGRVITSQGTPAPVPRYYKQLLKEIGWDMALRLEAITRHNMAKAMNLAELEPERRAARADYAKHRTSSFARDLKGS